MPTADLTTAELKASPPGYRRRRSVAAWFGLLALVLQTGFSLGLSVGLAAAPAQGSLAADLAALCFDPGHAPERAPDGSSFACDHCRLCSALFTDTPASVSSVAIVPRAADRVRYEPRPVLARHETGSGFPRAPPA